MWTLADVDVPTVQMRVYEWVSWKIINSVIILLYGELERKSIMYEQLWSKVQLGTPKWMKKKNQK